MVATPARIGFVGQEFRTDVQSNSAVQSKYGNAARDSKDGVIESFFDQASDYQAMNTERFALLSADRRRFTVTLSGLLAFTGGLDFSQVSPTVTLVDSEKSADLPVVITGIQSYDFETERTVLNVWG